MYCVILCTLSDEAISFLDDLRGRMTANKAVVCFSAGRLWKMGDQLMERKIKNYDELLRSGDISSRKIVLDIAEYTLKRLDSYERIKSIMRLEGANLVIGERSWDLSKKRHVYFIGAGKACNAMAKAVDEILGDYLTDGIAVVKIYEPSDKYRKIRVRVGGHPLPN